MCVYVRAHLCVCVCVGVWVACVSVSVCVTQFKGRILSLATHFAQGGIIITQHYYSELSLREGRQQMAENSSDWKSQTNQDLNKLKTK